MIKTYLFSTIISLVTTIFAGAQSIELLPPPGQYKKPVEVVIKSVTGDKIYYSLDGHYPDPQKGILFTKPIRLGYPANTPVYAAREPELPESMGGESTIFPKGIHKVQVLHIYSTKLDTQITVHYWIDSIPASRTQLKDVIMISSDADLLFKEGENGGILVGSSYYDLAGKPLNIPMINAVALFQSPIKQPVGDNRIYFSKKDNVNLKLGEYGFSPDSVILGSKDIYFSSPYGFMIQANISSYLIKENQTYIGIDNPRCSDLSPFPLPIALARADIANMLNVPQDIYRKNVTISYFKKGIHQFTREAWMQQLGTATRRGKKKQLRLGFNSSNGGDLNYDLGLGPDKFERLNLALGNSIQSDILFTRVFANQVIRNGGLDHLFPRKFKPVRVYLNGEDWGIYYMAHSDDNRYLESITGISDKLIAHLTYSKENFVASAADNPNEEERYNTQVCPFIEFADFKSDKDYDQLWKYYNKQNYVDYLLVSAYMASGKLTRQRPYGEENLDFGNNQDFVRMGQYYFLLSDQDETYQYLNRNELKEAWLLGKEFFEGYHPAIIFNKLTERQDFRDELLNRYSDMISTFLQPHVQKKVLNDLVEMFLPDWNSEVERWSGQTILPYEKWNSTYRSSIEHFIENRGKIMQGQFMDLFPGIDTCTVTVQTASLGKCDLAGWIEIGTMNNIDSTVRYSFTDIEVPIRGIPDNEFTFDRWELDGRIYSFNSDTAISFESGRNHKIVAYFTGNPEDCEQRTKLLVNEIVASNTTLIQDSSGKWPDYVELYNPTDQPISLSGLYVTDNIANPYKFRLKEGLNIDAKGYRILFADGKAKKGINHLGFKLAKDGEAFYLVNKSGSIISGLDYKFIRTDTSLSLCNGNYIKALPSPGKANKCMENF